MPTDDRPTPPERIWIVPSIGRSGHVGGYTTMNKDGDWNYRLSDPADPLVRLSDVERAVRLSLGYGGIEKAIGDNIIDECRRLTAERGEGGGSKGEGK